MWLLWRCTQMLTCSHRDLKSWPVLYNGPNAKRGAATSLTSPHACGPRPCVGLGPGPGCLTRLQYGGLQRARRTRPGTQASVATDEAEGLSEDSVWHAPLARMAPGACACSQLRATARNQRAFAGRLKFNQDTAVVPIRARPSTQSVGLGGPCLPVPQHKRPEFVTGLLFCPCAQGACGSWAGTRRGAGFQQRQQLA